MSIENGQSREPNTKGQERSEQYAVEVLGLVDLSEADFERGQRFVDALLTLKDVFGDAGLSHGDYLTRIRKGAVMVVLPCSPIRRVVVKASPFYEWQSPNEVSESTRPLLIDSIRYTEPSDEPDERAATILIEANSPHYKRYDNLELKEIYRFDITKHRIAIHPVMES